MLKSKKFRVICLAAAMFLALSGIAMIAYATATTLQKQITGCITYNPAEGKLDAYYQRYYNGTTPADANFVKLDALDTGNAAVVPTLDLTSTNGYIVFKLVLSTAHATPINCSIKVTVTHGDIYVKACDANGNGNADFSTKVVSEAGDEYTKPVDLNVNPVGNTNADNPIYIRVGLNGNAFAGDKTINIDVDITKP